MKATSIDPNTLPGAKGGPHVPPSVPRIPKS